MHIFSFLLSAVAFLLVIFALHLLFTRQGHLLLNRLLSVQLLGRFWQICVFLLLVSGYQHLYPAFQKILIPFFFAVPGCSYLYVRVFISGDTHLKKLDFLHFIPALLAIIHLLPLPFIPSVNWDVVARQILTGGQLSVNESTGLFPAWFYSGGQSLLVVGYLTASWYLLFASGFVRKQKWDINKTWLFFYLSIASFFKLLSFVVLIFNLSGREYVTSQAFIIVSCLVLLFMMAFVLYHPGILYGYVMVSTGKSKDYETVKVPDVVHETDDSYTDSNNHKHVKVPVTKNISSTRSKLTAEQQQAYAEAITQLMEKEQSFLVPDFQIIHLAQQLQAPVHHCSLTINHVMGKNFRDWLNSYRIRYFIKEYPALSDKKTIETVAYQSGFKNISTFYNAFKKETGKMPTTYFVLT